MLLLAGLVWISWSRAPQGSQIAGRIPAPQAGFLAPDFSLETAHGEPVRLSDLRGRVVIVNLWASWCGPCKAEMPALERIHQDYAGQGLVLLGVNATNQDSRENALAFAQEQGLSFPILFDAEGEVSKLYRLQALPTTFFIQPDGTIRDVVVGGPMAEALLRIRVEQLLQETQHTGGLP
jgi:cytochrome c biogenesis protein CcmG, thiol:disulfide interchange protein DsbE